MPTQVEFVCVNCASIVVKEKDRVGAGKFCNRACSVDYRVRLAMVTKPCETCGTPVTRKGKHQKPHTYCSKKCSSNSARSIASLAARNAAMYPDNRRLSPCTRCGVMIDKPKSLLQGVRTFCSSDCRHAYAIENPIRQVTEGGYIRLWVGRNGFPGANASGHILEHRKVMQDHIGRVFLKHENVHHVNGDRTDNRLENLELWSSSQPSGQRVADKLAWANEIIALYEGLPIA